MKRFLYFIPAFLLLWGASFSFAKTSFADTTTLQFQRADLFNPVIQPDETFNSPDFPDFYNQSTTYNGTGITSFQLALPMTISQNYPYGAFIQIALFDDDTCSYDMGAWNCIYTNFIPPNGNYATSTLLTYSAENGLTFNFIPGHTYGFFIQGGGGSSNGSGFGIQDLIFPVGSGGTIPPSPLTTPTDNISIVSPTNGAIATPTSTTIFYQTAATSTIPNVESYHVYNRIWAWNDRTNNPNNYIEAGGYLDWNAEPQGVTTTIPYPSNVQLQGGTTYTEQSFMDYCVSGITFTCYPDVSSTPITFNTPYISTANDQINLTYPANGSNPSDVSYFSLNYQTTFTGFNYEIDVNVSTSSDMSNAILAGTTRSGGEPSLSYLTLANAAPMTSGTTYYAQASLIYYPQSVVGTGVGQLVATSSVISFTPQINFAGQPNFYLYSTSTPPAPSSTATSSAWTLDCSNLGLVGNSLCSVLGWLFIPPAPMINSFVSNLMTLVKTKAPFGWFYQIAGDIQNINTSSTPAFAILNGSIVTILGNSFGLIDSYIALGIGVLFLFWVFHRFRNIKL